MLSLSVTARDPRGCQSSDLRITLRSEEYLRGGLRTDSLGSSASSDLPGGFFYIQAQGVQMGSGFTGERGWRDRVRRKNRRNEWPRNRQKTSFSPLFLPVFEEVCVVTQLVH